MDTQAIRLLHHLQEYGSITALEALELYGIARCGARIFDLKLLGYPITRKMETSENRYGQKVSYARYYL